MLKQFTWGEDFDFVIDNNVAVKFSTLLGPKDSGLTKEALVKHLQSSFVNYLALFLFVISQI